MQTKTQLPKHVVFIDCCHGGYILTRFTRETGISSPIMLIEAFPNWHIAQEEAVAINYSLGWNPKTLQLAFDEIINNSK